MKKLSLLMCAVASFGMLFTSCKKDEPKQPIDTGKLLTSGAYVIGEATGYATLDADGVIATGMATGLNEKTGETVKTTATPAPESTGNSWADALQKAMQAISQDK